MRIIARRRKPVFCCHQVGHKNAQLVYEINATGIEEMKSEQIAMLNSTLAM